MHEKRCPSAARSITSGLILRISLICSWLSSSYSVLSFSSLFPTFYRGSVRTWSTFPNGLSPVSYSCDSVSYRKSVSYTLRVSFIALESVAKEVLAFSLTSTCSARTTVCNTSSFLGVIGGKGRTAFDDHAVATDTSRLIAVVIAARLALCCLLFFNNVTAPPIISLVSQTSLHIKTLWFSKLSKL